MTHSRTPRKYTERELSAFENEMRIRLPEPYRRYLMDAGAGPGSNVDLLEDWCQPHEAEELPAGFLEQPFPHTEAWNEKTAADDPARYMDIGWIRGSMRIVNTGCEGYYLLVVSGAERGSVWSDQRVPFGTGIFPLLTERGEHLNVSEFLKRRR